MRFLLRLEAGITLTTQAPPGTGSQRTPRAEAPDWPAPRPAFLSPTLVPPRVCGASGCPGRLAPRPPPALRDTRRRSGRSAFPGARRWESGRGVAPHRPEEEEEAANAHPPPSERASEPRHSHSYLRVTGGYLALTARCASLSA